MQAIFGPVLDTLAATGYFPNGVAHYALGGALIGLAVAIVYLGTGIPAGASTFLESTLSYTSNLSRFQRPKYVQSRDWRVVFTVGIVAGAAGYTWFSGDSWFVSEVQPWRFVAGGFLVGVGTRLGKGCTSGHGVCGVGSASKTSIVNVVTFMLVAILVAQVLLAVRVSP